jgi:ribosomal protein S18 acetylase RimI-like enzyme
MLIEAVRVSEKLRGQKIGEWMISQAIAYGKSRGTYLIQLTTNKKRPRAKTFYEGLGFEATHEGMKLYI